MFCFVCNDARPFSNIAKLTVNQKPPSQQSLYQRDPNQDCVELSLLDLSLENFRLGTFVR
jgi:hypothetical protein